MVLVGTSIWVDHLRYGDATLSQLLTQGIDYRDPVIIGELVCANLQLLAICLLTSNTQLWTRDKRLASISDSLGIAFSIQ